MNSLSGFIKLFRKFKAWGWYQDHVVKCVFIHLLLTANYAPCPWKGEMLEEGQVVIGIKKLGSELGFSPQQVRTALNKLKSTNEITTKSTNKYTVVTIVNWRDYQSDDRSDNNQNNTQSNKRTTNEQQTNNNQITFNQQQYKNKKNIENKKNNKKREGTLRPHGFFENVFLTDSELDELQKRYPEFYEAKIERLSRYLESTGKTYRNHFSTLIEWLEEDAGVTDIPKPKRKTSYDINELKKINTLDFIE